MTIDEMRTVGAILRNINATKKASDWPVRSTFDPSSAAITLEIQDAQSGNFIVRSFDAPLSVEGTARLVGEMQREAHARARKVSAIRRVEREINRS